MEGSYSLSLPCITLPAFPFDNSYVRRVYPSVNLNPRFWSPRYVVGTCNQTEIELVGGGGTNHTILLTLDEPLPGLLGIIVEGSHLKPSIMLPGVVSYLKPLLPQVVCDT